MERWHAPVMLEQTMEALGVHPGGSYADGTFGEGGHSEEMLRRGAERVFAIDRDRSTIERYQKEGAYREDARLQLTHARLSEFSRVAKGQSFDGILVDLGVSTRQLLEPGRGFSFRAAGPLDMRMDASSGPSLLEVLDSVDEEDLARAIRQNTDSPGSRSLAKKVLAAHRAGYLKSTLDLANLCGSGNRQVGSHPATVLFLALRMLVNEELFEVENGIPPLLDHLPAGGRLAVITFHSTEDRAVKRLFRLLSGACVCERRPCVCPREERAKLVWKKPLEPSPSETEKNPRARSAKLRAIEKL